MMDWRRILNGVFITGSCLNFGKHMPWQSNHSCEGIHVVIKDQVQRREMLKLWWNGGYHLQYIGKFLWRHPLSTLPSIFILKSLLIFCFSLWNHFSLNTLEGCMFLSRSLSRTRIWQILVFGPLTSSFFLGHDGLVSWCVLLHQHDFFLLWPDTSVFPKNHTMVTLPAIARYTFTITIHEIQEKLHTSTTIIGEDLILVQLSHGPILIVTIDTCSQ